MSGTTDKREEQVNAGVERYKNSLTMQTAGLALRACREKLGGGQAELEKTRADYAVLRPLLDYAFGEAGLQTGDVDRLIGMAKAGGSEKEKVKAYLEKIRDDRTY